MDLTADDSQAPKFVPGVHVEVRSTFDNRWKRGFEIAEVERSLYRLRRRSDGAVLPTPFAPTDLRRAD